MALLVFVIFRKDKPDPTIPFGEAMLQVAQENGLIGMSVLAMCHGAYTDEFQMGMADIKRRVPI